MTRKTKIAICGGHLTCALATISILRQKKPDVEIIFFGRKHSMEGDRSFSAEYKIIHKLGIKFLPLTTGRLQRSFTRYTVISLAKIPLGFIQSFYYLAKEKPDVICSFGGYLSFPVVFSGWLLGIPSITHEQSVVFGLATKLNSFFVKKIAVSWPQTVQNIKNKKIVLTGNPIRQEIFNTQVSDSELKKFLTNVEISKKPLIYITGGNQGSHFLNEIVGKILPTLLENYFVIHQTGDTKIYKDYERLNSQFRAEMSELRDRYFLTKYIDLEDIGGVFNVCDLVVSRSGANIVTELLALGKPAILIPLPWAGSDEQEKNARLIEESGIGLILSQKEITPQLLVQSINKAIANLANYKAKALQAKKLIRFDAAAGLAAEVLELAKLKNK